MVNALGKTIVRGSGIRIHTAVKPMGKRQFPFSLTSGAESKIRSGFCGMMDQEGLTFLLLIRLTTLIPIKGQRRSAQKKRKDDGGRRRYLSRIRPEHIKRVGIVNACLE